MDENAILVEYLNNINPVVQKTFKSLQRVKLVCFDISQSFLVFGASSGGIYIFKREPCEFLRLIPSKEGSALIVAISPNERHLAIASNHGLVLIVDNPLKDQFDCQIYSEHKNGIITNLKWHRSELYVGDSIGRVSIYQTKQLFQIPAATIMSLDSAIVQIDCWQSYLLISTETKTYLCNVQKETFAQIGKMSRNGQFGACFLNITEEVEEEDKQNPYRSMKETEALCDSEINTKIICARPGARLWEAQFDAKVALTYLFKNSLKISQNQYLVCGFEKNSRLDKHYTDMKEKIPDNFNFKKIVSINNKFLLTHDGERIYIFEPKSSRLIYWSKIKGGIRSVAVTTLKTITESSIDMIYVWKNNLEILSLSVIDLETLILESLYRKQYSLSADICLKFMFQTLKLLQTSKKLYLLAILKDRLKLCELLKDLQPIFEKIKEINEHVLTPQCPEIINIEDLFEIPELYILKEEDKELKLMMKQYNLNKTHSSVQIPEVVQYFDSLNEEELFKKFQEFTAKEEDSLQWSRKEYLKQIAKRTLDFKQLSEDNFNFLCEALYHENEKVKYVCKCGFPLPKTHKNPPEFYKVALDVYRTSRNVEQMLKHIPYLWRYRLKTEIYGLNMTALLQYSHLRLFKEHALPLTYDNWHDILGYFVKLNKGLCLNCDQPLNLDGLFTWTDLGKVLVQSLGGKSAIKILEKYEKSIPNGALKPSFYQTCIFANNFINCTINCQNKTEAPFKFIENCDKEQFQEMIGKYLKRKSANRKSYYTIQESSAECLLCELPLNNDFLPESELNKSCGHRFHKLCYERNDKFCNICG